MGTSGKIFLLIFVLKFSFVISGWSWGPHDKKDVNKNVKVYYSPTNKLAYQYVLGDFHKIFNNEYFNTSRPTAIYVHGFFDDGEKDYSAIAIRTAYQEKNDTNFITIDWQYYSKNILYQNTVIPQLKIICETIAENLQNLFDLGYDIKHVHLIGHSLGGQCIGLVSRSLSKISNYTIPKLYALDPAGPGFEEGNWMSKVLKWITFRKTKFDLISKDDAKYVQIIHTNGGKYGIMSSRGHADFYPNNGAKQAGCDLDTADDVCSHRRAWIYYQESVIPRKPFYAIKCDSYQDFKNGKCKNNKITKMGYSDDHDAEEGNFYLDTNSNPLFTSLGEDGLEFRTSRFVFDTRVSLQADYEDEEPLPTGKPKWEVDIEYEKLLIVGDNGITQKNNVPFDRK